MEKELNQAREDMQRIMNLAEDLAEKVCASGDLENASRLDRVASHLRMASAEGRLLTIGGASPRWGGK